MSLPDKYYIILIVIMHFSYGKVAHRQKVDGLDLSFKTSKMITFWEKSPVSTFQKIFSSYMKTDQFFLHVHLITPPVLNLLHWNLRHIKVFTFTEKKQVLWQLIILWNYQKVKMQNFLQDVFCFTFAEVQYEAS